MNEGIVEGAAQTAPIQVSQERYQRLERLAARLRRGAAAFPADRVLLAAGWVLVPLGVALILLGWYGTAHTTRVWMQTPYLVSGGLLGLGLMFVGGFGYFAYWLTRLADQSRQQAAEAAELAERMAGALERIEKLLAEGSGRAGGALLVTTPGGTMAHRPGCPMVAGKPNLRPVQPDRPGLRPCMVCEPELTPRNGGRARAARRR